jgi:hypothetical protein
MALAGQAFLALWNDIECSREPEYDRWHTLEHMPERVAVSGFHGGRRYVNRARATHRYFTLYDVATLAVFESAEYLDLVHHPTPASASMRAAFRNFVRATCDVTASQGTGIGSAIACLCVSTSITDIALRAALDRACTLARVCATHFGRRSEAAADLPFSAPTSPVRNFDRVALVEALDRDAAMQALEHVKHALALETLAPDFGADVYELAFVFPGADVRERLAYRRAHWNEPSLETK